MDLSCLRKRGDQSWKKGKMRPFTIFSGEKKRKEALAVRYFEKGPNKEMAECSLLQAEYGRKKRKRKKGCTERHESKIRSGNRGNVFYSQTSDRGGYCPTSVLFGKREGEEAAAIG